MNSWSRRDLMVWTVVVVAKLLDHFVEPFSFVSQCAVVRPSFFAAKQPHTFLQSCESKKYTTFVASKTIPSKTILFMSEEREIEEDYENQEINDREEEPGDANDEDMEEEEEEDWIDTEEAIFEEEGDEYDEDGAPVVDEGDIFYDEENDQLNEELVMQREEEEEEDEYDYVAPPDDDDGDYEEGVDYELEDDPNDENYNKQKELTEQSIANRNRIKADEDFDALDYIMNKMTEDEAQQFDQTDFMKQVMETSKNMELTEEDVEGMDLEKEMAKTPDLMDDDPWPGPAEGNENELEGYGLTEKDMVELDDAWKTARAAQNLDNWDKVTTKADAFDLHNLSNETITELDECLEEIGGSSYNSTKWLIYDLDFNVTNLVLAAVKHNRDAPILFEHWYPQLLTYKRYQYVRDADFDWTWDDVENADVTELERYYAGFGYDEIPKKAPSQTGIIELEELDEEEMKMVAYENWVTDVYNAEWDRKDFDDDDFRDEDNVFSPYFEYPDHPDLPKFEDAQEDMKEWHEEMHSTDPKDIEYRDAVGRNIEYTVQDDEEFTEQFRGHLVVACTGLDSDLEIAEKITKRMTEEFGKQVFVETRVMAHAREDDNVFEVWLESYEIDLLHSKKRASMNAVGWEGPVDCDDKQVEWLVEKVGFLISDDARYSYRMYDESLEGSY